MENTEIIFKCNSVNNKNIRANELKILEKHPEELYFIFGENRINTKKRYYENLEKLNKDFDKLKELKEKMEKDSKNVVKTFEIEEEKDIEENIKNRRNYDK